jgi:hypothetical protein
MVNLQAFNITVKTRSAGIIFFSIKLSSNPGHTQPPIKLVPVTLSSEMKRQRHEADR